MDEELARFVQELTIDARHDQARSARQTSRWQTQLAQDEARFSGLLIDLNERASIVCLSTTSGRQLSGSISEIGSDFIAVTDTVTTFIRIEAITSLEIEGRANDLGAPSVRSLEGERSFARVISKLAEDTALVRFATHNAKQIRSARLMAAGADIVTLELSTEPPRTLFVATEHVVEISTAL
jgi:hypothetical protein